MDFETNNIIAFAYDLCKGCREIIQLVFPIHDKSKVDTEECILCLLSFSIDTEECILCLLSFRIYLQDGLSPS